MITKKQAQELAQKYNINLDIVPLDIWHKGLNIELEHGIKYGNLTNVTNDDPNKTAQIVIAHLLENYKYYQYLIKMEDKLEGLKKKDIFLKK